MQFIARKSGVDARRKFEGICGYSERFLPKQTPRFSAINLIGLGSLRLLAERERAPIERKANKMEKAVPKDGFPL